MLVWDIFRAHKTEDVKKAAKKLKTLAVIPGGLTSVLQPLDVCLNKPFKDRLHDVVRTDVFGCIQVDKRREFDEARD